MSRGHVQNSQKVNADLVAGLVVSIVKTHKFAIIAG